MSRVRNSVPLLALALWACRADGDLPPPYRTVAVPKERLASVEARSRGRALYQEHCALCHGTEADGKGVRREGFSSQPRDFTDPAWRHGTSPRKVFYAVREGVHGTAMPSWRALNESDAWDITAWVLAAGERRQ